MWQKLLATIGIEALRGLGSWLIEQFQNWQISRQQKAKEERDAKRKDILLKLESARIAGNIADIKRYTLELNKLPND